MRRPVGVTASAIVAIIGSVFTLLIAAMSAVSPFMESTQPQPPNSAGVVIAGAAVLGVVGALGIATSVGLFRLAPWARISILVFAGFLGFSCIFGLLLAMSMPVPPELRGVQRGFRTSMAVAFAIPVAISIWWLIQFNTRSTKAAFASTPQALGSARPASITVIAWASIVGAAACFIPILTRTPAFLFGAVFNGWIAGVIYALYTALSLYIGKGLLDLREEARVVAIGWFGLSLVHVSLVTLVPSLRERLYSFQRGLEQNQTNPIPFDPGMMTTVMFASTAIVTAIAIWFLIRNRSAFGGSESSVS
jgi:hypothetical protein